MRKYFIISFVYKNKYHYAIWFSGDGEEDRGYDGVLINKKQVLCFKNKTEASDYCSLHNLSYKIDDASFNLDELIEFITKKHNEIDCRFILNFA